MQHSCMHVSKKLIAAAVMLAGSGLAQAELTAEEKQLLGTTLTPIGAEVAGNADGSIPEYVWGEYEAPADYVPGSGKRTDPFRDEKPLFSINAGNMEQYGDKVMEGTKGLMTKFATYRIDVYPTHRTVSFPEWVLQRTLELAGTATLTNGGLSVANIHAAVPFPIPKDGHEAIWNHLLRFEGLRQQSNFKNYNVDSAGIRTIATATNLDSEYPYWDLSKKDPEHYFFFKVQYSEPPRRVGEKILALDPFDYTKGGRRATTYLPGQRRVKLAPEISFDTPNPGSAGVGNWDDGWTFNGSVERFDWKLVGKREVYVAYNNCGAAHQTPVATLVTPDHLNPDSLRWELHRVHVVEATLREGQRHNYHKRRFYLDEDSWVAIASDSYDARGELYKTIHTLSCINYDSGYPKAALLQPGTEPYYDLIANTYTMQALPGPEGNWNFYGDTLPPMQWTPDSLTGTSMR